MNKLFPPLLRAGAFFLSFVFFGLLSQFCFIFIVSLLGAPNEEIVTSVKENTSVILFVSNTLSLFFSLFLARRLELKTFSLSLPKIYPSALFIAAGLLFNVLVASVLLLFAENGVLNDVITSYLEKASQKTGVFSFFVTVIFVPFSEEVIFRGLILKSLTPIGSFPSAVLSSLLFALVHSGAVGFCIALIFGLLFASATVRFGLIYSVLLHMGFNLTGFIFVLERFDALYLAIALTATAAVIFLILKKGKSKWDF